MSAFNNFRVLVSVFTLSTLLSCQASERQSPVKVEILKTTSGYSLVKNGQPYSIKGAGIEFGDIESFARHGGNTFRTWSTDNAQEMLDAAERLGLMVALCIYVNPERKGFDFDDQESVKELLEFARSEVQKYKDHPALLVWMIGNELNLGSKNPKVYDVVNQISKMIHEIDPNHPTTTALAGYSPELAGLIAERAPDLDFISIQMYGELALLPQYIKETRYRKPYFITEWGSIGHWEMPKTSWGAPVEQDSTAKAGNYLKSYQNVIEPYTNQVVGSFVFLWGQKQERTPTWYGMFTELGEETETIDVMHYIWNKEWPDNRSPQHESPMLLDNKNAFQDVKLNPSTQYEAVSNIVDPDGDVLTYRWELKPESNATQSGGDFEIAIANLKGLIDDPSNEKITITTPDRSGAYRLFVYATDTGNNAAHANIPFYVN